MNPENLKVLAERASTVEGRADQRLDEVHARITQARRRRQVGVVAAAVVAVVLALTAGMGVLALTDTEPTPPAKPAPIPTPTPKPPGEEKAPARKVSYAAGHTIHWGDRTIDAGGKVGNVSATDTGVVFTRDGPGEENINCNGSPGCSGALWFTDGTEVVPMGRAYGTRIRGYQVEFASVGSTVVWLEPAQEDRPRGSVLHQRGDYVAYDTETRREVGRFGSPESHIVAVLDDYVYWLPDESWCGGRFYEQCPRLTKVMRFDVSNGSQLQVPWASYEADQRSRPRTLVSPNTEHALGQGPVLTGTVNFLREGNRLVPDDGNGGPLVVRRALTGERVRFTVPDGYTDLDWFPMLMWLDDDRLALTADDGDVLVCRLSSQQCRTSLTKPPLTGFRGRG